MNEFRIRLAKMTDLHNICVIEDDSFQEPYPPSLFEKLLHECPTSFFVAASQPDRLVGYCVSSINGKFAHLISIAVLRDQRGKGVGSALLDTLLKRLEARGVKELNLEVNVQNREAIALYVRRGFVEGVIVGKYYEDGSAALKMHLDLNLDKQTSKVIETKG